MKKIAIVSIFSASLLAVQIVSAATLAQWTFESSGLGSTSPSHSPGANTASTNFYAELGLQAGSAYAFGLHATAATYTGPVGNGSAKSLSANNWSVADYYQFNLSSVGYTGLAVSFDQTGSNTGPKNFDLAYSTDGVSFTAFGSYSLINASWSAVTPTSATSYSFDLSAITALDDTAAVYFRLVDTSTTSINDGVVGTGGTSRVDNFTVTATPIPEPSVMALLGGFSMLALVMAAKRRK